MRKRDYTVYLHINKVNRKVILQFSLDGEFIREFNSIKEASEEISISKPAIVHCLKGKTKKAGGYKWKYKYE